ncbi:hypothetical protein ASE01_04300 [Nocardioides sp. Root190]|uniref:tetratricopeptide repeat protein n=1 Tax=Nocardioides sp. Root190 TaxID=1736488 RepID=UPI0006F41665|nr:tetratricopeptide repeat protein [Nocardioides sp. Root190]KRB78490.1 hypothetical protein ASE01_04300 [Nocardioides sp. Root190]
MHRRPALPRRLPLRLVALALGGAVLLGGCGGGEDEPTAEPSASQSTSAVDQLVSDGLAQLEAGDLDKAGRTFEAVLLIEPDNAYAHYNLGFLAQQRGDKATAIGEYTDAISSDPEMAPALYNLGLLTENADLDASVDLYRRVLAVKPDDAATHMRLGFALRHLGHEAEAKESLAKGVDLDPAMADVTPPTYAG